MTEFEKIYQNYNPRQAALDEARALLTAAAKAAMADGALPEAELPAFIVEIPADTKNGDIASNIAMAGARSWRKAPKMIADALLAHLPSIENSVFAKVEVAGPGFINLFLAPSFWASVVLSACSNKEYGRTDHGKGAKYNVEFVSANPTGPMHMGNARGGALGDCLSAVLDWSGYDVTREFYINDAGNQIQKFGKSLAVRYLQKYCGEEAYPLPAECYQGGDIKVLAGEFAELNGDKYVAACKGMDEETLFESEAFAALKDALVAYALPKNIAALKRDLGKYRIDYARIDEPPGIEGTDAQNAVTHRGGYILRIHLFGCAIHEFDDGIDVGWFSHTLISSNIWFRYSCVRCTACGEPAAARSSSFLRSCCFTVAMPR